MALTREQWYSKLKTWVPAWVFEIDDVNVALFFAIAKVLADLDQVKDDFSKEAFIMTATGAFLDLHGSERGVTRLPGEFDSQYAVRIRAKSTVSQVSPPSIKSIVDALLIQGEAAIREDFEGSTFVDREEFVNRGVLIIEAITNTFTIFVDKQIRTPESFTDREAFADRENIVGDNDSSAYIFDLIVKAVNENKALGTLYRVIERFE